MPTPTRVTIWNEYRHERDNATAHAIYPDGMHDVLCTAMRNHGFEARTATLDEPDHGLTPAVLDQTDVLIWWGHRAHGEVRDEIVDRVQARVVEQGMGLIVLHSGHFSKLFKRLMGTGCDLKWREAGERERLWVVSPGHPIAQGIPECIVIEHEEMYGEHFDIPQPDHLVFVSWFPGGEVFRSGCCFYRGRGKIFYFRPGHETYPTYHHADVQRVIANAVRWARPAGLQSVLRGHVPEPHEPPA